MLKKILALLLISFILSSCSNKIKKEEITFTSWGSITEIEVLKKVITDFEQKNPDIKINFIHIPQNYFQKIHLLFASNTAPDVIFINNLYLPIYADKLLDLSDYINKHDFFPQSLEVLSYKKELLAIPRDISNLILYYNKDIIEKPPQNFEELDKLIKKYSSKNCFGISFERDVYWAEPYLLTLGHDKGLDYYRKLEGTYAPTPAQIGSSTLLQMFINKKLAFYLSGRWMYPKLKEFRDLNFGIIAFPGKSPADSSGWAISKDSKHIPSAIKFVQYLSSKENIDYLTSTGLIVPARLDSAQKLNNEDEAEFLRAISQSEPHVVNKNYKKNRDILNMKLFN